MTFDTEHLPEDTIQLKAIIVSLLESDAAKGPVSGKAAPRKQGCWSHARRCFVKAGKANYSETVFVLEMIGELYEVEDRARKLDAEKRLALRQAESIGILDRIFAWCRENQGKYLPKEAMRTAIDYLLRNESALRVYCTDGRLEIDNNACERMLRQWAVGRKNWLFFGNERGGKTASILVTILSSARRHGLNEFEYLYCILRQTGRFSNDLKRKSPEYRPNETTSLFRGAVYVIFWRGWPTCRAGRSCEKCCPTAGSRKTAEFELRLSQRTF